MKPLKPLLVLGLISLMSVPALAELYRWVDANGQVHYSDTPQAGAEEIVLRPTNVIQSPSRRQVEVSSPEGVDESQLDGSTNAAPVQEFSGYQALDIASPNDGAVLWNIGGELNVQLSPSPALQRGHGIVVYLDGRAVNPKPLSTTSVKLENVYRGTHTVRASIFSETGQLLFNGSTNQFQVQQSTAN